RLRPETSLLAAVIQEVNGRAIRRLRSCECGARQRPHTQQVFVNALAKGRLIGRLCVQAQGRFTHCSRPPSPPSTTCGPKQRRLQRTVGAATRSKGCFFWGNELRAACRPV